MISRPLKPISGVAAPLPGSNIDTDVIMPKQFLKTINRENLANGAFHDLRFDEAGKPRPDFVLNQSGYDQTVILVTGPNFGCGSSREHAVWGLMQLGIRAIIGSGYGGIFFDNAMKNGLLLVTLDEADVAVLLRTISNPATAQIDIDLGAQEIIGRDGFARRFQMNPYQKDLLQSGQDHIDRTLDALGDIKAFQLDRLTQFPWLTFNADAGTAPSL